MSKKGSVEELKKECESKRTKLLSLLNRISREITQAPHSLELPELEEGYPYTEEQLTELSLLLDDHFTYLDGRYGGQLSVIDRRKKGETAFFIRYVFFDTEHDIAFFIYDTGAAHLVVTNFERDDEGNQVGEEHDYNHSFSKEDVASLKQLIDSSNIFDAPLMTTQSIEPITSIFVDDGDRRLVTRFAKDVVEDKDYQKVEQEIKRMIGLILSRTL